MLCKYIEVVFGLLTRFLKICFRLINLVHAKSFDFVIGLFQVASTCLKLVNVSNLSWLCWVVSKVVLHAFFFLSLQACLRLRYSRP